MGADDTRGRGLCEGNRARSKPPLTGPDADAQPRDYSWLWLGLGGGALGRGRRLRELLAYILPIATRYLRAAADDAREDPSPTGGGVNACVAVSDASRMAFDRTTSVSDEEATGCDPRPREEQ